MTANRVQRASKNTNTKAMPWAVHLFQRSPEPSVGVPTFKSAQGFQTLATADDANFSLHYGDAELQTPIGHLTNDRPLVIQETVRFDGHRPFVGVNSANGK